jgi:hypothetical protein
LEVEWRDDVRAIWDKWLNYGISLEEFREGIMVKGVANAKTYGAIAWIADGSDAKGVFSQEIQDYIASDVFKTFRSIGIKYFVSVQPKSALTKLGVKRYESQLGPHGLELVAAETIDDAIAFLRVQIKRTA